jgi:HSP20 family molecular chaperone IbpA
MASEKKFYAGKKSDDEKSVWFHYMRDATGNLAQCKKCNKEIKTVGGSTKGLHTHLQTIHKIDLLKRPTGDGESSNEPVKPSKKSRVTISSFFVPKNDKSLAATVARLVAVDGLSFNVICTSVDIRAGLLAMGHQSIPTSPNTIKTFVVDYAKKLRFSVKNEIEAARDAGKRFSLTFDEWSSLRNRRYMNINVHSNNGKFWSLGLTRVEGSMPATKCIELVQKRLSLFGLCLETDIVGIVTDGASVMTKVGKLLAATGPAQQLCFAHGLQLAVLDVLYSSAEQRQRPITTESTDKSHAFPMKFNMSAFKPDEMSVEIHQDGYLTVKAKSVSSRNHDSVNGVGEVCRRVHLPAHIDASQLSSTLSIDGILTVTCAVPELNNDRTTDGGGSDSSDEEDDDPTEGLHITENDEQVQQPSVSTNYSEVIQKVSMAYKLYNVEMTLF